MSALLISIFLIKENITTRTVAIKQGFCNKTDLKIVKNVIQIESCEVKIIFFSTKCSLSKYHNK